MVVKLAKGPITAGLKFVQGSFIIILVRWALLIIMGIPAYVVSFFAVGNTVAHQPYYTSVPGRMSLIHWVRLAQDMPSWMVVGIAITIALTVLGEQILCAGAMVCLDPGRVQSIPLRILSTVLRSGADRVWAMLRILLTAAALAGLGIYLIHTVIERLVFYGEVAGWTGRTLGFYLPLLKVLASASYWALIGAWAFWCRLVLLADSRKRVRSTGLVVLKVWRRHLWRAPVFYFFTSLMMVVGSGAILTAWRQTEPQSICAALAWLGGWWLTLFLQSVVWHWLIRSGHLLYSLPDQEDLHQQPDKPWGIVAFIQHSIQMRSKQKT